MSGRRSFDEELDQAIDALRRGESLSRILAAHPEYADALRPLLQAAADLQVSASAPSVEPSTRLAENYSVVRQALHAERARLSATQPVQPRWWRRRLSFASFSVPAGLGAVLLVVGAAAAAVGTVSQTTGVPRRVERAVTFGRAGGESKRGASEPTAARTVVGTPEPPQRAPGSGNPTQMPGSKAPDPGARPGNAGTSEETPAATRSDTATPGSVSPTPPDQGVGPYTTTVSGTIGRVNGNSFTLTNADGDWKVNIDANTVVNGDIAEGGSATISGEVTAGKNLHASRVDVAAPDSTPGSSATSTPAPGNDHTPGPPADHTPPGQAKTPGSQGKGR